MNFQRMQESAIEELTQYKELAAGGDPRAAAIQNTLLLLPERERDILDQFYISREGRYAGHRARLQAKYCLCISDLYRARNDALTNYCVCKLAAQLAGHEKARST